MRSSRWLLVALLLVFSAAVALACGGDGDEGDGAPAATSPAGEAPEEGDTSEARDDGGDSVDLARKFGGATFKATYELSGSGLGELAEGTMTWYKKGDSSRIDIEIEVGGEQMSTSIITRPDQSYFCTRIPAVADEGSCMEAPGEPAEGVGEVIGDLEGLLNDPEVDVESTGGRKIAGEDADCFTVDTFGLDGETEVCVSEDGVPLSMRTTMEGAEIQMEATDFSDDVSDDDFEPPYPVGEGFPGLPDIDIDFSE